MNNPFEALMDKELLAHLHKNGQLDGFLRDYHRRVQLSIHPDRGGDTVLAAKINSAYQQIKQANGNLDALIGGIGSDASNPEHLSIIEALSEEVERLQKTEKENEELRTKLAEALAGKFDAGVKTKKAGARRVVEEDGGDEPFVHHEPRVRTPPRAGAAGRRAAPEPEPIISKEPIVLHDIFLYDAKGKPLRKYKTVTLAGESVKTASAYASKTQDGWTTFYAPKREKNISFPLLYAVLERMVDEKHPGLAGLAKEIKESWLSLSTRINYSRDAIIHNYGTSYEETFHCPIPYGSDWMENVKSKKAGRNALRALLMAKDLDKTDDVLQKVCGVKPYLWTPDAESRKAIPERAAFVNANSDRLDLDCDYSIDNLGRSRSVVVE